MSLESSLYTILTGAGAVSALIGTRVYPDRMPQNLNVDVASPYVGIVYQRISTVPAVTNDGGSSFVSARIQVSCYARTADALVALVAAVRALNGAAGGTIQAMLLEDERGGFEPEPLFFRRDLDFEVQSTE